jgi:hypothetical protein
LVVCRAQRSFLVGSVVLSFVLSVGIALAQSTVWDAAKDVVPADVIGVVRFDVAAIRNTAVFARFVPELLAKDRETKETLRDIRRICKVDVVSSVQDVVVAMRDDETGVVFVRIAGVDRGKVTACITAVAESRRKVVTAKGSRNIVEYSIKGYREKLHVGWLTPEVAVVGIDPTDRMLLVSAFKRTKNGFASVAGNALALGSVNMNGLAWGVINHRLPISGATILGGHVSISAAAGVVSAQARVRLSSALEASLSAALANKALADWTSQRPPELAKIAKGAKIKAVGEDVSIVVSAAEADIVDWVALLLGNG